MLISILSQIEVDPGSTGSAESSENQIKFEGTYHGVGDGTDVKSGCQDDNTGAVVERWPLRRGQKKCEGITVYNGMWNAYLYDTLSIYRVL